MEVFMESITLSVTGMSCEHCEKAVVNALTDLGATNIVASAANNSVELTYNPDELPLGTIQSELNDMGYQC